MDIEEILTVNVDFVGWAWGGQGENTDPLRITEVGKSFAALLDSTRPFIYLPPNTVSQIVREWGLNFLRIENSSEGYYFLNTTQAAKMDKRKPFLQFDLGQITKGEAPIVNPYKK
jgi:hypothetical protein